MVEAERGDVAHSSGLGRAPALAPCAPHCCEGGGTGKSGGGSLLDVQPLELCRGGIDGMTRFSRVDPNVLELGKHALDDWVERCRRAARHEGAVLKILSNSASSSESDKKEVGASDTNQSNSAARECSSNRPGAGRAAPSKSTMRCFCSEFCPLPA